jgi:hypothetical protein
MPKLALIFSLITSSIFSQNQATVSSSQRELVPKSPEASAFNKYGDIGVSHFTGSANISFPLNISEDVPISISYNALGNKPNEHHGWVGEGFNLNVGGMISRIKKGDIDEHKEIDYPSYQAYYYNYTRLQDGNSTWSGENVLTEVMNTPTLTDLGFKKGELEPDEFVFNFLKPYKIKSVKIYGI